MACADHDRCTVNEAELTILELGARMRQRMEEVSRIDAEFKNGLDALLSRANMHREREAISLRCSNLIARKRRDMASLQYMIDSITAEPVTSRQIVSHLEALVM